MHDLCSILDGRASHAYLALHFMKTETEDPGPCHLYHFMLIILADGKVTDALHVYKSFVSKESRY